MQLTTSGNTVTIIGNIKSIQDYQTIKTTLDELIQNSNTVIINLTDSISIISSVIGYLNKLVLKDNIVLQIIVGNSELYELFDELALVDLFKVKKA